MRNEYSYIIYVFEVYDLKLKTHCRELFCKMWHLIQIVIVKGRGKVEYCVLLLLFMILVGFETYS